MQQSTHFPPVSSSTPFYQPLCSSQTCLSPVFTVLQRLFELPCHFESVGNFSLCRSHTAVRASSGFDFKTSTLSTVPFQSLKAHSANPLAHPLSISPSPITIAHLPLSQRTHSFDSPYQPSTHPFSESFSEFYCVRARCTCVFTSFFRWWKVGHGLGLVFEVIVNSDADVAMFGGGTWSRASWQDAYSILWCSGSY